MDGQEYFAEIVKNPWSLVLGYLAEFSVRKEKRWECMGRKYCGCVSTKLIALVVS